ncbi:MAG: cysteine desulfurase [Erysipelothrix sp.]|nr:cysteine desulfurase [Erysipelothrix sp.]
MSFKEFLYLDNTSSTKIDKEILKTYTYLTNRYFANASSLHTLGVEVKNLEIKAKNQVLDLLKVKNYRLIFTSGATEANNIAIKSIAIKNQHLGKHLITSKVEHDSVYNSFKFLADYLGFEVTYLNLNQDGTINLDELKNSLRPDTILVSIIGVNNEIGTIINHQKWCKLVKENSKALCHVDMVQALGKIDLDFLNVDLASFSAHKINGINGSGFLLIRDHLKIAPLISGGSQQDGFRGGTSNSPANIVLAKTVRLALEKQEENNAHLKILSDFLYKELKAISTISLNSIQNNSVYNIINFSVNNVQSEIILNALNNKNIYISAGSTCQDDLYEDSRVLKALNKSEKEQRSRIRIGLDASLTIKDLQYFIETLKEIINDYAI